MKCTPISPTPANAILSGIPSDRVRIVSQHYVHDTDGRKHGPHGQPRKVHGVAMYDCACDVKGLWGKMVALKSGNGQLAAPKRQPERCDRCLTNHAGEC